jgi:hypothetical protein
VEETAHTSTPCQLENFEHTGDELTKWRVDPIQPTVEHILSRSFNLCDLFCLIAYGGVYYSFKFLLLMHSFLFVGGVFATQFNC